tara:strand:- start:125 stop:517 length:393 start_codon:yes stop_codon:yes gene_type:complete|mmetsp:Transcript_7299/g.22100  ORF Transcript_7299/g.22100 Transcript_7299/m.22100 type:complete len:131 (-) Transcript_7299:141-533(-)
MLRARILLLLSRRGGTTTTTTTRFGRTPPPAKPPRLSLLRVISTEERATLERDVNALFADARDEIESALESKGTTYFDEDAKLAKEATKECLDKYEELLRRCGDSENSKIRRSMGLKIEQLKAEAKLIDE